MPHSVSFMPAIASTMRFLGCVRGKTDFFFERRPFSFFPSPELLIDYCLISEKVISFLETSNLSNLKKSGLNRECPGCNLVRARATKKTTLGKQLSVNPKLLAAAGLALTAVQVYLRYWYLECRVHLLTSTFESNLLGTKSKFCAQSVHRAVGGCRYSNGVGYSRNVDRPRARAALP
jgi:hypothetical protein